jgi:hypothetical protein
MKMFLFFKNLIKVKKATGIDENQKVVITSSIIFSTISLSEGNFFNTNPF